MKKLLLLLSLILLGGCSTTVEDIPTFEERVSEAQAEGDEVEIAETGDEVEAVKAQELDANLVLAEEMEQFETNLPILMFHYIEDVPADSPDQVRYNLSFSPQNLEGFLKYFKENGVQTLTFWDLKQVLEGKMAMPQKAVMLTFDDGYDNQYTQAFKLLEQYQMKGVFYIITEKVGIDPAYVTWDQVKEMAAAGHEIGSHTVTHRELNTLSEEEISNELVQSKEILEKEIGLPVISLCYPVGRYDERVIDIAQDHYLFARTTEAGHDFIFQDRYRLPTARIFPTTGLSSLELWLN